MCWQTTVSCQSINTLVSSSLMMLLTYLNISYSVRKMAAGAKTYSAQIRTTLTGSKGVDTERRQKLSHAMGIMTSIQRIASLITNSNTKSALVRYSWIKKGQARPPHSSARAALQNALERNTLQAQAKRKPAEASQEKRPRFQGVYQPPVGRFSENLTAPPTTAPSAMSGLSNPQGRGSAFSARGGRRGRGRGTASQAAVSIGKRGRGQPVAGSQRPTSQGRRGSGRGQGRSNARGRGQLRKSKDNIRRVVSS
eukprot:m.54085 g.54085  ORF g.54085 m.54085 type:complete len:253 (+) comp12843_c0_seq1:79-837(+)